MAPSLLPLACLLLATGAWSQDAPALKEKFTTSLLKTLAAEGKNVVFSPVSMESALGIVGYGARGQTMEEVFGTLGYKPAEAKQALAEKQKKLNETPAPGATWQTANRIMAAPDLPVKKEYIAEVSQAFPGVVVDNFDFQTPAKTAAEVNSWVSAKTNKVINKLLDEDSINPETRMIVLNAVYFKGEWKHGFDKKLTREECFYSEPGKCTKTQMMHIKEDYKYGYHSGMNSQIIEFPYKNPDYSMIVVLPDERRSNLTAVLANLNVDDIIQFVDERKWPVEVHVTFPKFEIEFEQEMKEPLKKLGMKNIFTDASDLSGMISGLRANVDSVIHKAKITCDEEGTVAAAATGGGIFFARPAPPSPIIRFIAERPFIYFVLNKKAGVLFTGVKS